MSGNITTQALTSSDVHAEACLSTRKLWMYGLDASTTGSGKDGEPSGVENKKNGGIKYPQHNRVPWGRSRFFSSIFLDFLVIIQNLWYNIKQIYD